MIPINRLATLTIALAVLLGGEAPLAHAADTCESLTARKVEQALAGKLLRDGLTAYLRSLLATRRYFEGSKPDDCTPERQDHPLYPGIPYRDCTYREMGLQGWVRLAAIPPGLAADWILNACGKRGAAAGCAVQLTAYTWCSNQLPFPIVGSIIEPSSSGRGAGSSATNFIFLHGVTIARPDWIPVNGNVDAETRHSRHSGAG
jgi:hypothetical protein